MDSATGFVVTANKGISIKFANGCEVSVQWGTGNYCSNRDVDEELFPTSVPRSALVEVAAWDKNGEYIRHPDWPSYEVTGNWETPEFVAAFIADIATREG